MLSLSILILRNMITSINAVTISVYACNLSGDSKANVTVDIAMIVVMLLGSTMLQLMVMYS